MGGWGCAHPFPVSVGESVCVCVCVDESIYLIVINIILNIIHVLMKSL